MFESCRAHQPSLARSFASYGWQAKFAHACQRIVSFGSHSPSSVRSVMRQRIGVVRSPEATGCNLVATGLECSP